MLNRSTQAVFYFPLFFIIKNEAYGEYKQNIYLCSFYLQHSDLSKRRLKFKFNFIINTCELIGQVIIREQLALHGHSKTRLLNKNRKNQRLANSEEQKQELLAHLRYKHQNVLI